MSLTYRELTPEEFPLAPRDVPGSEVYTPDNSRILAALNEDGEIVATWTMWPCVHIEPVWVRKDYRRTTGILRGLARAMKKMLRDLDISEVYTVALDKTPVLQRFARWFGANPVSGTLYHWKDTDP